MSKPIVSLDTVNRVLAELPAYVEIELTFAHQWVPAQSQRLMSRDLPGPERRFTNLTTGSEWFLPLSENLGVVGVSIPAQEWKVES